MMSLNDFESKQILFLVTKEGQKLSFKNDNVVITDSDGKILHQSTCYRLFAILIVGHITITSGLIQRAKKFGFSIALLTPSFRLYQTISNTAEANVLLRQKQYNYKGLNAGISLTRNKIMNQRTLLINERCKSEELKEAIIDIDKSLINLDDCENIRSVMGVEGSTARVYFKSYFDNVIWHGRKPRIKNDMTNALLDIGYTVLFCFIDALLSLYGFDKYYGILHTQFYMRKSLVCDLVEPFRVIVDKCVKKGINLGQFKEKDFDIYNEKWCLKYKKSSEYNAIFLGAIMKYKDDMFIYIRDFYRCIMKEKLDSDFPMWLMGS